MIKTWFQSTEYSVSISIEKSWCSDMCLGSHVRSRQLFIAAIISH